MGVVKDDENFRVGAGKTSEQDIEISEMVQAEISE